MFDKIKKDARKGGYDTVVINLSLIDGEWKEVIFLHDKQRIFKENNPTKMPVEEFLEEKDEDLL